MVLVPTPSQTVGPFFNFGLTTDASLGKMGARGRERRADSVVLSRDGRQRRSYRQRLHDRALASGR